MTSENICKVSEYEDSIFYKAHCNCMSPEHEHCLELSYENHGGENKEICLTLYSDLAYYDIYGCKWYQKFWKRIKIAFSLLIGGHPEIHDCFLFNGEKAVEDYIKALQEGLEKLKSIV